LSSAHIYLRLREGDTWDNIPEELLTDLAQLTKANSIEGDDPYCMYTTNYLLTATGNKKDNITIIYTPWSNLKKDGSMAAGQVSFKDNKKVKKVLVPQRENPIVNRLNKTKTEKYPDLKQEKDDHLRELRKKDQAVQQARVCPISFVPDSQLVSDSHAHTEKGGGPQRQGAPGKEVPKGPRLRRAVHR
jgi:hypothetical protein